MKQHRLRWTAATLAALTAFVSATACTDDHPRPATSKSSAAARPRVVDGPAAPDGGVVRIVESGFSSDLDYVARYSFGAVVENTSKEYVVQFIQVIFKFFDTSGEPTTLNTSSLSEIAVTATSIPPGGKNGVGSKAEFPNPSLGSPPPAKVVPEFAGSSFTWIRASLLPTMTISSPRYDKDAAGNTFVSFVVDSEYPSAEEWPNFTYVFRNTAGAVIGGLGLTHVDIPPRKPKKPWPQGRSIQTIGIPNPVVVAKNGFDPAKTDIYVSPVVPDVGKDGKPVNR